MTEDQEKSFLKLKLEEERTEYLKGLGLWDDFYSMPDSVREAVLDGEVAIGWTRKMLVMSLGWPYDQQKVVGNTSALRTERFIYRFEQHADGTIFVWTENSKTEQKATRLFRREIVLADDRVMEITEKENW